MKIPERRQWRSPKVELYACICAVDGFNLFQIPHNIAYAIPQTELWPPHQSKFLQLNY